MSKKSPQKEMHPVDRALYIAGIEAAFLSICNHRTQRSHNNFLEAISRLQSVGLLDLAERWLYLYEQECLVEPIK